MPEEDLTPRNPDERGIHALHVAERAFTAGPEPARGEMAAAVALTLQRNRPLRFSTTPSAWRFVVSANQKELSTGARGEVSKRPLLSGRALPLTIARGS
jgi:hypothetical protein